MTTSSKTDPFAVSQALTRALQSHHRLQTFKQIAAPACIVDKETEMRERYLDKLLDLLPRELSIEDMEVVTVDCILRALRNEVLLDLCRSPRGKQMVGAAVSVALRSRWSDEDDELPPELLDDDLERLEDDVARQSPRDRETNAG